LWVLQYVTRQNDLFIKKSHQACKTKDTETPMTEGLLVNSIIL